MKISSKIWLAALSLFGIGCSDENGGDIPCMYGTPTGSFEIKGKVTTENGVGVGNAAVKFTMPDWPSSVISVADTSTDSQGSYEMSGSATYYTEYKVVCIPESEELEPDSVIINLNFKKGKGDSDMWYHGHAEATVDFKLKKKDGQ